MMKDNHPGLGEILSESLEIEDSFHFWLLGRYLVNGYKTKDCGGWRCTLTDTLDGWCQNMFLLLIFEKTKAGVIKRFLEIIQAELSELHQAITDQLYEISKEEYLSLMDKEKEETNE